jgi:hypothetical protein
VPLISGLFALGESELGRALVHSIEIHD